MRRRETAARGLTVSLRPSPMIVIIVGVAVVIMPVLMATRGGGLG